MMAVVTDSRPTDRSVKEKETNQQILQQSSIVSLYRLKGIVTEISNLVISGSNE
jgi:hypothetical protein